MKRSSVRPSHPSTAAAACGGFAAECPAVRRYRSQLVRASAAYQLLARHAAGAAFSRKCGQRHVDSRSKRLNTGLCQIAVTTYYYARHLLHNFSIKNTSRLLYSSFHEPLHINDSTTENVLITRQYAQSDKCLIHNLDNEFRIKSIFVQE